MRGIGSRGLDSNSRLDLLSISESGRKNVKMCVGGIIGFVTGYWCILTTSALLLYH